MIIVAVLGLALHPAGGAAQEPVRVVGRVQSAGGAVLGDAVVYVEPGERTVVTGPNGGFTLDSMLPGQYTLAVNAPGFATRRLRLTVSGDQRGVVDVGTIALEPGDEGAVVIRGIVRDARTGQPLARVPVRLNGLASALTRADGSYRLVTDDAYRDRPNRLVARRIGYEARTVEFTLPATAPAYEVDVALEPSAVELDPIDVAGKQEVNRRLAGFRRRRQMGLGTFFTRVDIEKIGAVRVSDVVRRVPGTIVITEESVNADPMGAQPVFSQIPRTTIQFSRRGYARDAGERPCSPLIFVNDMQVNQPDIDMIGRARDLEAVEVYTSAAQIPAEYNRLGSECGVIALWLDRPPGGVGRLAAGFEIGGQYGSRFSDGGLTTGRVGVQMLVPLFWRVDLRPAFNAIVSGSRNQDRGWQAVATVAVHPVLAVAPWYVGTGIAVTRLRSSFGGVLEQPRSNVAHVVSSGVSIPLGPFRPFVEFQVLDPLAGSSQVHGFMGFTIRTNRPPDPFGRRR